MSEYCYLNYKDSEAQMNSKHYYEKILKINYVRISAASIIHHFLLQKMTVCLTEIGLMYKFYLIF